MRNPTAYLRFRLNINETMTVVENIGLKRHKEHGGYVFLKRFNMNLLGHGLEVLPLEYHMLDFIIIIIIGT